MSIYSSLDAPAADEHLLTCAFYEETEPGVFDECGDPCDCGMPAAPFVYLGSHVMPEEGHERGGWVDLAGIHAWVRNDDEPDAHLWLPWLRFGVNGATVVLRREHVEQIVTELTGWLQHQHHSGGDGV